jgi:hypothetical protein
MSFLKSYRHNSIPPQDPALALRQMWNKENQLEERIRGVEEVTYTKNKTTMQRIMEVLSAIANYFNPLTGAMSPTSISATGNILAGGSITATGNISGAYINGFKFSSFSATVTQDDIDESMIYVDITGVTNSKVVSITALRKEGTGNNIHVNQDYISAISKPGSADFVELAISNMLVGNVVEVFIVQKE